MVGNINNPDTWLIGNSEIRASGFGVTWKDGGDTFFDEYLKGAIIDSVNYGDMTLSITIQDVSLMVIPEVVILFPNYTNPFNSSTIIRFKIPEEGYISVTIFDIMGRQVRKLFRGEVRVGLKKIV